MEEVKIVSSTQSLEELEIVRKIIAKVGGKIADEDAMKHLADGFSIVWYGIKDQVFRYHKFLTQKELIYHNYSGIALKDGKSLQLRMEFIVRDDKR